MQLYQNQSWNEIAQPVRWKEAIRPAMAELEARLPGMLGADIWLHRNVSRSDLDRITGPQEYPAGGKCWPLMYLVCYYRKALFGVQLEVRDGVNWKMETRIADGLSCFRYAIDAKRPSEDLERVLKDISEEAYKAKRKQKPLWQCSSRLIHMKWENERRRLLERGLVRLEEGVWHPTERGEDVGLITCLTVGKGGVTKRELRWSLSTEKMVMGIKESGPISLQARFDQLEQGLSCRDSNAAKMVQQLAEMPLADYILGPDVNESDLIKLQNALGLQSGCVFRTAAAALYRRLHEARSAEEKESLMPLVGLLALPIANMKQENKASVMRKFRRGRSLT